MTSVLRLDLIVFGEGKAEVGAVYLLLCDDDVTTADKVAEVPSRHDEIIACDSAAARVDHVVRAWELEKAVLGHLVRRRRAPLAQQLVRILQAADCDDLVEVALRGRGRLEKFSHALNGTLASSVRDGRVVGSASDTLLTLLGCSGGEVDACNALSLGEHREVHKPLPIGRFNVAAIEEDASTCISAKTAHHLLDALARTYLVLRDPHPRGVRLDERLGKRALASPGEAHEDHHSRQMLH
mmetsp:Transcript_4315/g.9477  ORF Transcript_4315/g.9477 Transcript_4315/m.9477 type:complete len:240 (+) Transcript_4315:631-1350(+)